MLTFDLMGSRRLINQLQCHSSWDRAQECALTDSLNSIALSAQSKLPYVLLDVGSASGGPDFQSGTGKDPQSSAVKAFISPTRFMSDSFLAWDLKLTLKGGIYAGAYWDKAISTTDAKHYADQFVNQFMTGEGEEWYDNGGLSNVMRNTPEGQRLMRQISAEFRNQMFINQGDFTRIKLSRNIRPPSFGWKSSPTLKILVGGTQRLIVTLAAIVYNPQNCRWMSVINVEIRDDFGVTEGDITNASPSAKLGIGGLADMWVLQHRRGKKPFTSVFNFSFICYDNN